jgi:hypothetical protein
MKLMKINKIYISYSSHFRILIKKIFNYNNNRFKINKFQALKIFIKNRFQTINK